MRRETDEGAANRDLIERLVLQEPGITRSELRQATGLGWGTIVYHVRRLGESGRITEFHDGRTSKLIPTAGPRRFTALATFLRERPRHELLEALRKRPGVPVRHLAEAVGVSRKVALRHLECLREKGFVTQEGATRPTYALNPDRPPDFEDSILPDVSNVGK